MQFNQKIQKFHFIILDFMFKYPVYNKIVIVFWTKNI
jgi:hypothetical protein